jgi:glycosyltransferase involved in cell wall biosynthesis
MRKVHRVPADMRIRQRPGLEINLLRGLGYRRNLSLARIWDHRVLARRFSELASHQVKPDIILASFPAIELCLVATRYGRAQGVPVVLDVRDLWPDIFLDYIPAMLRPLGRLVLRPLCAETAEAFRLATAITGITRPFVEWGLKQAGRMGTGLDRDFPMGYPVAQLTAESLAEARLWWKRQHGVEPGHEMLVVFFGSFGRQVDIETVLDAARRVCGKGVRFVLCGDGERLAEFRRLANGLGHVVWPGWIDAPRICALMAMADVGLAPYFARNDFLASYPNKVLEYLSGGLPVLSAIDGLVGALLGQENCGLVYGRGAPAECLARMLEEMRDNPERLREMAGNARRVFAQRFSADRVYGEMVRYLEAVADEERNHIEN